MKISYHGLSTSLAPLENVKMFFRLIVSVYIPPSKIYKTFTLLYIFTNNQYCCQTFQVYQCGRHRDIASIFSYKYKPLICEIPAHKLGIFFVAVGLSFSLSFPKVFIGHAVCQFDVLNKVWGSLFIFFMEQEDFLKTDVFHFIAIKI